MHVDVRWLDADRPSERLRVDWIEDDEDFDDLRVAEDLTTIYQCGYMGRDVDDLHTDLVVGIDEALRAGRLTGKETILEHCGLDDRVDVGTISWSLVPDTEDERQWLLERGWTRPEPVERALEAIQRSRAQAGLPSLDPDAAGWTEQDILDEAERVTKNPADADMAWLLRW